MLSKNVWREISILLFVMFVMVGAAAAQGDATPTPAPSKTAVVLPTLEILPTITPSPEVAAGFDPLTQSDLTILTGNVQRPNGIVWHDGKIFTACNGDFTLYEIDPNTASTRTYIWGVRNAHTLYAETTELGELNLWVPDYQQNQLVRVDRNGVVPILSDMKGPWGITSITETEFLVSNLLDDSLTIVNRDGAARTAVTDLRSPTGLATDGAYAYIANTGSARRAIEWVRIAELPASAEDEKPTPQPLVTGLQNTSGMMLAADGYLYFAYSLGTRGVVGRVNPEQCRENGCTNEQVEIVVYTELAAPLAGLTISPDMRLFVHTIFSPDIYWVQLPQ